MEIIRGDTKSLCFKVAFASNPNTFWTPSEGDKVYFTCKKLASDKDVLIQKIYPDDISFNQETSQFSFTLLPKDTKKREFGKYKYDIEIKTKDGIVKTVCLGDLIITEEVTHSGNEV